MTLKSNKSLSCYRPDIDGLRAVAVLSVIIFHIDKSIFPGGFVGVDLFFVISGYLITLHILMDLEANRFSIIEFYQRRVKRIAPVMLVVVASVVIVSLFIQRPDDTREVAKTSIAAVLSLANVYFWLFQDSSYFAQASNETPLLHLWSLGVEEQFYMFWPLILMGFYRRFRGKHFFAFVIVVAAISFAAGHLLYPKFPSFVYYMLPTRVGELLIGALVACFITRKYDIVMPDLVIHMMSIFGITLVAVSLFYLSEDSVFPGLYAIPPTVGVALLIVSGHYGSNWVKQILMVRPLVFLGLISYSAYLWHWPLLSFARYSLVEIDFLNGFGIFLLTISLSVVSYYLVERPARKYEGSVVRVFCYQYVIPSSFILVFSFFVYNTDGFFMHNNSEEYKVVVEKLLPAYAHDYVCQEWELTAEEINKSDCVLGGGSSEHDLEPNVILWGDSHAAHYIGVLGAFAKEAKFNFRNLAHSACPPIFADPTDFVPSRRVYQCQESLRRMRHVVSGYEVIVISSAWVTYNSRSESFLPLLFKTVKELNENGGLVVLLGSIPKVDNYDRVCREKAITFSHIKCSGSEQFELDYSIKAVNEKLKYFASTVDGVEYFDIVNSICEDGLCSAYSVNGEPLYYDSSHLSMSASWNIGQEIVDKLSGVPYPFTLIEAYYSSSDGCDENGLDDIKSHADCSDKHLAIDDRVPNVSLQ